MGLTSGTGPFGHQPEGRFNFTPDPSTGSVLYFDPVPYRLRGVLAGETIFDTLGAKLLYETAHLPVYYIPEEDLRHDLLEPSDKQTHCPHKGDASYRSLRVGDRVEPDAVWTYREPIPPAVFLARSRGALLAKARRVVDRGRAGVRASLATRTTASTPSPRRAGCASRSTAR